MGEIERGQHLPNFALILRLASTLKTRPCGLVDRAAARRADSAEGSPDGIPSRVNLPPDGFQRGHAGGSRACVKTCYSTF